MSLFLDVQYLNEISYRFEKFTKKGPYLYNLRCPICGDSSRNKHKARGYFYQGKDGLSFKCHNCGATRSFGSMLQEYEPLAYRRYKVEKFKQAQPIQVAPKKMEPVEKPLSMDDFEFLTPVLNLPKNHESKKYLFERMIPLQYWRLFWYVEKTRFLNALSDKYIGKYSSEEPRLVIPFFGPNKELLGVTCRSFEVNPRTRYLSLKLVDDETSMIFGQERFDRTLPGYVVEGPIDSLFLPNCLANGNASLYQIGDVVDKSKTTLVFDNQPRNKDVCLQINRAINKGYRVTMWPDSIEAKDINEMVMSGLSQEDILYMIEKNSYSGLTAQVHMKQWRKC